MSLPFILDVAISLVFIYLIISLLASEIQEVITTLLQWRAAHLKKAIEVLLSGSETSQENLFKSKRVLQEIYDNPLLKNISQESRGGIEAIVRKIARTIVTVGRNRERLTLKGDEPSYIPAETFATTLLERLQLSQFAHRLTALNLQILANTEIVSRIEGLISNREIAISDEARTHLRNRLSRLKFIFKDVVTAYADGKASLPTSIYRLKRALSGYLEEAKTITQDHSSKQGLIVQRLAALQEGIFYDDDSTEYSNTDEVIRRLQPTLAQVLDIFVADIDSLFEKYSTLSPESEAFKAYSKIKADAQRIAQEFPTSVRDSLAVLARRAEINVQHSHAQIELIQQELKQFQQEIQSWFDRSMERASGVYKRNAKGVGFVIGLLLAIIINADTFHIASQLTTDSTLRDALVSSADVVARNCSLQNLPGQPNLPGQAPVPLPQPLAPSEVPPESPQQPVSSINPLLRLGIDLFEQPALAQEAPAPAAEPQPESDPVIDCVTDAVGQETALPLGWGADNLERQTAGARRGFLPLSIRRLLGWGITGLAISMGATFWFELLGKLINVRNAGKRPDEKTAPNKREG